jgi:hypothetical protein
MIFRIGQKVRLLSTGEVGIVVWNWRNENGDIDVYVAFFGMEFPVDEPEEKPYVLRYYDSSLEPID